MHGVVILDIFFFENQLATLPTNIPLSQPLPLSRGENSGISTSGASGPKNQNHDASKFPWQKICFEIGYPYLEDHPS